jgi:lysyl-tRNA synthetase class 2
MQSLLVVLFLSLSVVTTAFTLAPPGRPVVPCAATTNTRLHDTIVSPFDTSDKEGGEDPVATLPDMSEKGPLDLTWENVELVLDDMRPYLIQDGGNVAITEIDGPVVRLELQGACGTCPSSTVSIVSRLFSALVVCSQSHL